VIDIPDLFAAGLAGEQILTSTLPKVLELLASGEKLVETNAA
jgi:hypothetical protein